MALHPMNPVDRAWFHMDGPTNTAMVMGMLMTRHRLDLDDVRRLLAHRLVPLARFRRRVVEHGIAFATPAWEDVPDFDITRHVHHHTLPEGGGEAALRRLLEEFAGQPLPASQPLWRADVIDGPGEAGALVLRYHHCIADGVAMMDVARRLFDGFDDPPAPARPQAGTTGRGWLATAWKPAAQMLEAGLAGAGTLAADLLKSPDPVSPFKGRFVRAQHLAWSRTFDLEELKAIGRPHGARVNDVLVAAMAGALRQYLRQSEGSDETGTLRAMLPVNLRRPEQAYDLGNEFGLVILELPIEIEDPLERLAAAKARMDALKQSSEAVAMRWLFELFGRGPQSLQAVAQHLFGSKTSIVMTNVPGPAGAISVCGRRVSRLVFWVPHPGEDLGLGVSFLSYHGKLGAAVIGDARRVPDPQRIVHAFEREVERLRPQADA